MTNSLSKQFVATENGDIGEIAAGAFDSAIVDILLRTSAAAVGFVDRNLRYLRVNEALAAMHGHSALSHRGRLVREMLPNEVGAAAELLMQSVLDTGVPVVDRQILTELEDGTRRHFLVSYVPVRDNSSAVAGVASVMLEQTSAEHALRESKARMKRIAESGIVGIFFWSMEGGISESNDAFLEMLGYTQDDLAQARVDWRRMTPPEFADADERALEQLHAQGFHGQIVKEYIGRDGQRVPVIVTSALLEGSDSHGVCVCLNDTARRSAEQEHTRLLRNELDLAVHRSALLDAMSDGFAAFDTEWRYTYVNGRAEQLLGMSAAELVGRNLWEVFPQAKESAAWDAGMAALHENRLVEYEYYLTAIERWISAVNYPVPGGVAVVFRDVTAERQHAQERDAMLAAERATRAEAEQARREAEAASRAKSEFLAVMSHELRTPLNAIGGYAELIQLGIRGPVTGPQLEDLGRIQKSQRHLLALINEVLNYSRLETGAVVYACDPVSLAEAVTSAEEFIAPQLRAKELQFHAAPCDASVMATADREKLQQILLNLFSNAVKFTTARNGAPGMITVRCNVAPNPAFVQIAVEDTGHGIPEDKLDVVFEPFTQVDTSLVRTQGGAGLGLAISRDLARGMGGDLVVRSTVSEGSVFTILLPRHLP